MPEKVYYSMYSRNAELYHHGIKGQKWGVRNGPPYPLDSDVSTGSRLRKEIGKVKDDHHEKKIKTYKKRLNKIEKEKTKKFIDKYSSKSLNESIRGDISSELLESIAPAASFLTACLVAFGIASAISNAEVSNEIKNNIEESEKSGPLKKTSGAHTIKSDIEKINPNYYEDGSMKWKMNCVLCSASYDMRRRGYDVTAMPSKHGRRLKDEARMYNMKKKDINKADDYSSFKNSLLKMPEGARGIMTFAAGDFGSSHAVAWEKHNDKILIIDAQDGKIYDFNSAVKSKPPLINTSYTSQYTYFRTDDKDFNEKYIRDSCRNR